MRPSDREGLARRSLLALFVLWLLLIAILGLTTSTAASGPGRAPPQRWWVPLAGCLVLLFGLHLIYFRREDAAFFREQRERWGLSGESQTPAVMVLIGIVCIILGLLFVASAIPWFLGST
jgi:uncharacterized membrane protein HdeD (DUF308 family)